jgi:hypothetical protein
MSQENADAEQVWEIRDGRSRGSRTSPTRRLGPGAGAERDRRRTAQTAPASSHRSASAAAAFRRRVADTPLSSR